MITLTKSNAKERCRTCLRKLVKNEVNPDNFGSIMECRINFVDINTYKQLHEILHKYVIFEGDEEVSQYREYPQNVCVDCLKHLQTFDTFRNRALDCAKKLYRIFSGNSSLHKIELNDEGEERKESVREQLNTGMYDNDIFNLLLKDTLMETEAIILDTQETDNNLHNMDPDPFQSTTKPQPNKRRTRKGKRQREIKAIALTKKKTRRTKHSKEIPHIERLSPTGKTKLQENFALETKAEPQAEVESDAFDWQQYDCNNQEHDLSDNEELNKQAKHSRRRIQRQEIKDAYAEIEDATDSDPDFIVESLNKTSKTTKSRRAISKCADDDAAEETRDNTRVDDIKSELDSDVISTDSEFGIKPNINLDVPKSTKKRHYIMNSGRKKGLANSYKCDQCQHRFGHKLTLEAHVRKVHEGLKRAYQCQLCDKAYSFIGGLSTHIKDVHERQQDSYDCNIEGCDKKYSNVITLQRHIRFKHLNFEAPNQYVCEQCGATFKQTSNLRYHMRTRHPTEEDLKRKEELPKDRLECEECKKSFHSPYTLKYHKLRVHADEKKFECKICGRRVAKQFMLDSHMLVHSEQKLACKFCGREFVRKYQVEAHTRAVHQKLKPFQCPHCSESFASRKTLRHHIYIHTGEKPYVCDICGQAYRQPTCLKNHRKIHNKLNSNEATALAVNRTFLNNFIQNNEVSSFLQNNQNANDDKDDEKGLK